MAFPASNHRIPPEFFFLIWSRWEENRVGPAGRRIVCHHSFQTINAAMEDSYKEADTTEYANEMYRLESMKRTVSL